MLPSPPHITTNTAKSSAFHEAARRRAARRGITWQTSARKARLGYAKGRGEAAGDMRMDQSRLTVAFLNLGHFLDHLAMLIYATAVLVMTSQFGLAYQDMLPLSLGGFIAFGGGSLPAGWLGDRWGRRNMMLVFFLGLGAALVLAGLVTSRWQIVVALTLIGVFASIYHPVGIAMLVKDQARVGRALGWNGVWGNLGLAFAAFIAGWFSDHVSWRAAFIAPGIFTLGAGVAFALLVPNGGTPAAKAAAGTARHVPDALARRVFAMLALATAMMFVVFGLIPINDAMVARYAHDSWRSRVYAVRYVVSFGAGLPAIPLVAYLQPKAGGFAPLFGVLAAIALGTLVAALLFPSGRPEAVAAPAPAE